MIKWLDLEGAIRTGTRQGLVGAGDKRWAGGWGELTRQEGRRNKEHEEG